MIKKNKITLFLFLTPFFIESNQQRLIDDCVVPTIIALPAYMLGKLISTKIIKAFYQREKSIKTQKNS